METGIRLERLRADIFGNFAAIFLNLPDLDFAKAIAEGRYVTAAGFDAIEDIVPLPTAQPAASDLLVEMPTAAELVRDGLADIEQHVAGCKGVPLETVQTDLGVERTRLVRGIARGYGPPPPYGMTWKAPSPEVMGRLNRFFKELDFSAPNSENPTYIGVELSFLSLLCQRIAEVQEGGGDASHFIEMRDEFVRDDVIMWVPKYCEAVIIDTKLDFFRGVSRLLIAALDSFGFPRPIPEPDEDDE